MNDDNPKSRPIAYLVGGGIASLAAAAFLIRDGDFRGDDIFILEASPVLGGSLDAAGHADTGYTMRGGRMLESKYNCTFDLFSSVPTLNSKQTVTEEIFHWNDTMKTRSRSRLFRDGKPIDSPAFGLSKKQVHGIEKLLLVPESMLGRGSIAETFDADFFKTDFWFMWCTTFAFQPWHSVVEFRRYLLRFTHMVAGFSTLTGIMRTKYNQFESLVLPLRRWLSERGVQFVLDTQVTDLTFLHDAHGRSVETIFYQGQRKSNGQIQVRPEDYVLVTLGSMTEGSTTGSMDSAPLLSDNQTGSVWTLWNRIATREADFGRPSNFTAHVDQSKWVSFTTTIPSYSRQSSGLPETHQAKADC